MPPKSLFLTLSSKYVWDVALEEVVFHSHHARPTAFEILLSVANAFYCSVKKLLPFILLISAPDFREIYARRCVYCYQMPSFSLRREHRIRLIGTQELTKRI